jgi:hypothetical protein
VGWNDPYYGRAAAAPPPQETSAESDNQRHDLYFLNEQITRARDQVSFEWEDGDITREQRKAEIHRLAIIARSAHELAKANGGTLTSEQENTFMRQLRGEEPVESWREAAYPAVRSDKNLEKFNEEIGRLKILLDKKVASGDITKAQHDGTNQYLLRLQQHVQEDASANNGSLLDDQTEAAMKQLQRVDQSVSNNFVVQ